MNIFDILLIHPLASGLAFTTQILGNNLGLGIIIFSFLLRLALTPLTKPYLESMKKMREFAPQLAKLKKKHSKDKVKLAQAQAEFYKQKGINPGAGCLPYILQIVVLFAFFRVFDSVLVTDMNIVDKFNELIYPAVHFASNVEINTNFLGIDLISPDIINISSLPFPLPGVLIVLAAVVQLLSSLISNPQVKVEEKIAEKTKTKEDDLQASMQKSMMYTFPLFTLFIGMRFPAGLALYWLVVSLFQFVQQYSMTDPKYLPGWLKGTNLLQSATNNGKTRKR